jgi:hypothetical protein
MQAAEDLHARYLETSALTGEGIQDLLGIIADLLVAATRNPQSLKSPVVLLQSAETSKSASQGCC